MARSQEEFRLSCVIADYFRRALPPHVLWSAFPAGENRDAVTGSRLKRMGLQRGWPDYLVIHNGRTIGIELKVAAPVSAEQRAFGDALTAQGGAWTIARSLEDVETFLRACEVPLLASAMRLAA